MRTITAPNKKGPRKLKSWPLLAAQNVYRVRLRTTTAVRMTDSNITFPVSRRNTRDFKRSDKTPHRKHAKQHPNMNVITIKQT
jgi:hypothetical protein